MERELFSLEIYKHDLVETQQRPLQVIHNLLQHDAVLHDPVDADSLCAGRV